MNKTITVFGSSIPIPGTVEYERAFLLGKFLGKHGINVCTGGYKGIMDAVSKGAVGEGVQAIGITVDIFNSKPSKHLTSQIEVKSLFERLSKLINTGDGFIILPGGTGTMLELSLIWEKMNKGLIPVKPAGCLGDMWKKIVIEMESRISYEKRKTGLIKCFDNEIKCAEYVSDNL